MLKHQKTQSQRNQSHLALPKAPNINLNLRKPDKTLTPDRAWNKSKSVDFRPPYNWISTIAKARKPSRTFDEIMGTPIDFSAYVMNRLKIDNLTQEILAGAVPADYFINNDLEYLKGGSLSSKYVTSTTRNKAAKYDNIEGIEDMVPTLWSPFKEGDFPRLNLRDIEDMLLLLVEKKLSNLDVDDRYDLGVALRMFTRRIVILHRVEDLQLGVESYKKKLNINRQKTTRFNISKLNPYTTYKNPQGIIY
nr:hypothetical protein [Tanacetum cinerariifolium]